MRQAVSRGCRDRKEFFKIPEENLLVIYDDFDTEPGKIRIRKFGTAGSHNGMISVI